MTSPRNPGVVLPIGVSLAALVGFYIGAYWWMMKPVVTVAGPRVRIEPDYRLIRSSGFRTADNRFNGFFAPIHWLDRRIRPHVWEPTP